MSLVSVVIPVGPGHGRYLAQCLTSVASQGVPCQVIVVNDSGEPLAVPPGVRLLETAGRTGAGAARNAGLVLASAPFVSFLDADDYYTPGALRAMVEAYALWGGGYIYGDWWVAPGKGAPLKLQQAPAYDRVEHIRRGQHVVTTLMPTATAKALGGFDPALRGWEDWEFYIRCAVSGVCGSRLPMPVMVYRLHTGARREDSHKAGRVLVEDVQRPYLAHLEGKAAMGCCGGTDNNARSAAREFVGGGPLTAQGDDVLMEYLGTNVGAVTYRNPDQVTRREYRGGKNAVHGYAHIDPHDVAWAERSGRWRRVPTVTVAPPPPPQDEAPDAEAVTPEDAGADALAPGEDVELPDPQKHSRKARRDGVR